LSRRQAMQQAVNAGARLINYVRRATDYLVHGAVGNGDDSSKMRRAKSMIGTGAGIRIMEEDEFLSVIGSGKKIQK
jgi:NAD-dependent DNA ligase